MTVRTCKYCHSEKPIADFYSKNMCSLCRKVRKRIYAREHQKIYKSLNREKVLASDKKYKENNKDKKKDYDRKRYLKTKPKRMEQARVNHARRLKEDPVYRLRSIVSTSIGRALKKSFSSKNGSSILKHLPYTIQELKDYLENLFEFWMTWENYGTYRVDIWNDNDPSTWTWHLDHIIPHSRFQYTTMEERAFKDCWALSNLRPYSAKQNIIDGNRQ